MRKDRPVLVPPRFRPFLLPRESIKDQHVPCAFDRHITVNCVISVCVAYKHEPCFAVFSHLVKKLVGIVTASRFRRKSNIPVGLKIRHNKPSVPRKNIACSKGSIEKSLPWLGVDQGRNLAGDDDLPSGLEEALDSDAEGRRP